MPRVAPVPLPPESPFVGNQFRGVLTHCPELLERWSALGEIARFGGTLPPTLKEEVRRSTAAQVGCAFCASFGDPKDDHPDAREEVAVRLARRIVDDPTDVGDALFDELRQHFREAEIVELVALICLNSVAGQMFGAVMSVDAADAEYTRRYEQWVKDQMALPRMAATEAS